METILESEYLPAAGTEGLSKVLLELYEKSLKDAAFAQNEHYILYQLGQQKSLIKVDMSERPYQFWYYDLLGRPITRNVKETIAKFVWEKTGEKERYMAILNEDKNHG